MSAQHVLIVEDSLVYRRLLSRMLTQWGYIVSEAENGVDALAILGDKATKPIVVRLDGNAVEIGRHMLTEAAHPLITLEETMDAAARRAAELAAAAE